MKVTGLFAVFLTGVSLFSLAGYQITSVKPATRLLGRQAAALIELDRWLPAHREDILLLASDRPQNVVAIKDLPVQVTLPSSVALDPEPEVLRRAMVEAMGTALYREGNSAFRDEKGDPRRPGIAEPLRWSVELLGSGAHGFWQAALALSLLLLLASLAAVLMSGASPVPPLAIGAGLSFALSLAVWLSSEAAVDVASAPVDKEIVLSVRDGAWIGMRNAAAVAVVMIGLQLMVRAVSGREQSWRGDMTEWDLVDSEVDADAPTV